MPAPLLRLGEMTEARQSCELTVPVALMARVDNVPMLSEREKLLYHQIHPLKAVDITTSLTSTWLRWRHELLRGLLVAWVPSLVVTMVKVRWMDFTRQRDSTFGRYVANHLTHAAEAVRFAGQFGMWFGAWFHAAWAIVAGVVVIIFGWTYSLPFRRMRAGGAG